MNVEINYIAVVVAMVSSMVVGAVWYSMGIFGSTWAKLAKVDMTDKNRDLVKPMVTTIVVSFLTAYVLAHVTYLSNHFFGNSFLQDALSTAFWVWLGFTAARFITHDAFEGRPTKLTVINIGNELVTLMVMGLIIGLFGV